MPAPNHRVLGNENWWYHFGTRHGHNSIERQEFEDYLVTRNWQPHELAPQELDQRYSEFHTWRKESTLQKLNEQWSARVRQQQSEQSRRDDSARHSAIISTAECLVRIQYLLGLLLLCMLLILWKGW